MDQDFQSKQSYNRSQHTPQPPFSSQGQQKFYNNQRMSEEEQQYSQKGSNNNGRNNFYESNNFNKNRSFGATEQDFNQDNVAESSAAAAPLRNHNFKNYNNNEDGQNFERSSSSQQLGGMSQPLREQRGGDKSVDNGMPKQGGYQGKNFDPNYKNRFNKFNNDKDNENNGDNNANSSEQPLRNNYHNNNRNSSQNNHNHNQHHQNRNNNYNNNHNRTDNNDNRVISQPYHSNVHAQSLLPYNIDEGFDNFVTVLMVAEKPSIARSIAEALGGQGFTIRKGICRYSNVFTFYGHIFGKKALIKVTSVIGHIYTTDFTPDYQDWRRVDPYKLFNATTQKKETNPTSQIIPHLQKEAMGASYLVLWLDNDREGENICFEVLTICKPELIKEEFQQIYRAKFSSITPSDIRQAYDDLSIGPNFNQSQAVDARQIIDLKVGVAFSRFQTRYLVRKYEDLNNKKITFGPCQTPTLAFCVQRDDEIKVFNTQPFYKIIPKISLVPDEMITLEWTQERTYDKEEAYRIKDELEQIGQTTVVKVDNKETQKIKPIALNTVQFLKMASKQYGLGPQNAMQLAEKLYLGGYITYPRTESTKYPEKFDFSSVLDAVCQYHQSQNISQFAQKLAYTGIQKTRFGKDVGDHPPITPTNKILKQQLSRDEQNIYELVCRHYLASISTDCRLYKKKVVFQTGNHVFSLIGTAVIDKGFMEALPWQKIQENEIPNFVEGDQIYLHSIDVHVGKTQPPDHLTESDLIGLMEQHGIGTDASMAQHIANISEREYVQVVGPARRLVPTELGAALIHSYNDIDSELVAPNLRSSIEKSVELISQGELDKDQVLQSVIELFKNKYLYFVSKVNSFALDKYFDPIYQSIELTISKASYFTKCGRCKKGMKLLDKIGKIFCCQCKFMYGLPKDSKYSFAGECYCPVDGFQLMLVEQTTAGNTKRFTICPLCYQKPPEIENYTSNERYSRTSCNLCINRNCQFSMINNEIGPCLYCKHDKEGSLVLDWPKDDQYSMTCNRCSFQYQIQKSGQLIRSQMKCVNCTSYQIKFEGKDGFTALGCLFCDEAFKDFMVQRPPIEDVPLETQRNERYYDKEIKEEQSQTNEDKSFKSRAALQPKSLTYQNKSIMELEINNKPIQETEQPPKRRRGRPAKVQSTTQDKENMQDDENQSLRQKKIRSRGQKHGQNTTDDESSVDKSYVDYVKKGISKPSTTSNNSYKMPTTQSSKYTNNQQQQQKSKVASVGANGATSILEDSQKQDLEFFSKFPNNNNMFKQNAETLDLLKDASRLLAEIEAPPQFTLENSSVQFKTSSLHQYNNQSYKNNQQSSKYNR